ncbi:uncharacterized protein LOC105279214 isoform X3 [Ooceraea biroi]|uniref:uncharacterized protein LOC105279214 isoform X3 n=1 Tax=Ooceraea biroi TaxID=2015173 RepID=UPI0005B8AF98|nr:uncharacterized protein LOC105279214 isoform X3 [Ooceraea biroi]
MTGSSLTIDTNPTNIDTSNVILDIEESTCVSSHNYCDTEQYIQKSDSNLTLCGASDKDSNNSCARLTENTLPIDKNLKTLVDSSNVMSCSSLTIDTNSTNSDTSNVILDIEESTCVPSHNYCDTEQHIQKSDSNLTLCGATDKDGNNCARLTEDVLMDKNFKTVDSSNMMSDLSLAVDSNITLNSDTWNAICEIEGGLMISNMPSNITENFQCGDECNSTFTICENANGIEKCKTPKKCLKTSEIRIVSNILVTKTTFPTLTQKTDNITCNNIQLNNTYSVTKNNNVFPTANNTCHR